MKGLHKSIYIFPEYYNLVTFEVCFPVFFTFDNVEKNITIPIFFNIEKIRSFF